MSTLLSLSLSVNKLPGIMFEKKNYVSIILPSFFCPAHSDRGRPGSSARAHPREDFGRLFLDQKEKKKNKIKEEKKLKKKKKERGTGCVCVCMCVRAAS
jgi:hypothetical protein